MAKKKENVPAKAVESLFNKVSNLIEQARVRVATAMNVAEVYTKYQIGRYIVEEEQSGKKRAEYGKQVLEGLSERLTARYGDGWSYSNLRPSELAGVIKNHVSPYSPVCSPNTVARQIETHSVLFDKEHAALFAESRSHRLG